MTISSTTRRAGPYIGNGVATSFAFAFKVFEETDVVVTLTTIASGAESTLVLTTDYTLTLNPDQNASPGGSVTYNPSGTPMPATKNLTITSAVPNLQETDVINTGEIALEVLEEALDRNVVLTQQIAETLGRSLSVPVADNDPLPLPSAAARANKFLSFDASGDPVASTGMASAPVSGAMTPVVGAASLAAAAAAMGVIPSAIVDAKGDIIVATAADTVARKAVSTNGYVLVPDSTQGDGLIWTPYAAAQENAIIGGDFSTNPFQRGTAFVAAAPDAYVADKWRWKNTGSGVATIQAAADGPTVAQCGKMVNVALLVDCTTADAAIAAGDLYSLQHSIEGYSFMSLLAQRPMVLVFGHRHTKTGTYCVSFRNTGGDRSYVAEYTQAVSNAWEMNAILIPASPSAGTWAYNNGIGLIIDFCIAAGSSFHAPSAGSWQNGNYICTASQVNGMDNTANNFNIACVELRAGNVAIPIAGRYIHDELKLCQRYYEKTFNQGVAPAQNAGSVGALGAASVSGTIGPVVRWQFAVTKRTNPTIVTYNPSAANTSWRSESGGLDATAALFATAGDTGAVIVGVTAPSTDRYYIHATANADF